MYTNDLEQMFGFLYSKAEAFHIQKKRTNFTTPAFCRSKLVLF